MTEEDGGSWISFGYYPSRMMNCLMDQMSHQVRYGWVMISSATSFSDGSRLVVVQGSPVYIGVRAEYSPESKTADYVETNLALVDGAATANVKHSQIMSMDLFASRVGREGVASSDDGQVYSTYNWLSCLSAKTGHSKGSLVFLFVTLLLVLVWFLVGVFLPIHQRDNKDGAQLQKLSIYGDMDYLTPLDSKAAMIFSPPHKFTGYTAAPLIKLPLQEI